MIKMDVAIHDIDDDSMCLVDGATIKGIYASKDAMTPSYFKMEVVGKKSKMAYRILSEKQLKCLKAIDDYIKEFNMSPTKAELGIMLGVSREKARRHVNALVDKGYVVQSPYERRGLYVTADGREALAQIEVGSEEGSRAQP